MFAISVVSLVVSILTALFLATIIVTMFGIIRADEAKDGKIKHLEDELERCKIRNNLLNEAFTEYRGQYPIKTKYRVGSFVFLVENKKVYHGLIIAIHQGRERDITYTIQYAENGKSINKIIDREQGKVYSTLAEAIEAEKLVTL